MLDRDALSPTLTALSDANDTVIFLTDTNGKTLYCTEGSSCEVHRTYRVPSSILQKADAGQYTEAGRLENLYKTPHFTVCQPVKTAEGTVGYLFVSADNEEQGAFVGSMLKIFLICAVAVLAVSFILTYFVTLKMVRPLREMSAAAKKFGQRQGHSFSVFLNDPIRNTRSSSDDGSAIKSVWSTSIVRISPS